MRPAATAILLTLGASMTAQTLATHHVHGTFTVDVKPLSPAPADGITRFSINKQLHGGLEGTTRGEMFGAGDFKKGAAGYVAIEQVTGTLDGKQGTFVLQHLATMDANGPHMQVGIVPGSGTGQLQGITGTFTIVVSGGEHSYDLDYTLPQ
jgi:hypothetical protein